MDMRDGRPHPLRGRLGQGRRREATLRFSRLQASLGLGPDVARQLRGGDHLLVDLNRAFQVAKRFLPVDSLLQQIRQGLRARDGSD
jgi:hypothetical protein